MTFERIRHRLESGRPLVVDSDTAACFRARGVELDSPGAFGVLLRERSSDVLNHYRAEVSCKVDVISALTADTTPRALAEVGMQHRAAQLTGRAVELALEAASESDKPIAVAGVLGSDRVSPIAADRLQEELNEHAERLTAAGCELLLARGQGSWSSLMAAVTAGARTGLPTWIVLEYASREEPTSSEQAADLIGALVGAGGSVVLLEVAAVTLGLAYLERFRAAFERHGVAPGVLLAASEATVRGFDDDASRPERWAEGAATLGAAGARAIGGGAGTTEGHTRHLAEALGSLHPSVPPHRPSPALDRGPGHW